MADIATLFTLVKTLSKSEKRYFQLFNQLQQGEKQYLKLYRLLEDAASAEEVYESASQVLPGHALETARKHLYKILMKGLRNYETEHSVEARLLTLLADIQILYSKGLMGPCLEQIAKAKRLALQFEKFSLFLAVARLELQYLTRFEFTDLTEEDLIRKQQEISQVLERETLMNRHAALYEILLHRYLHQGTARSPQDVARLNDLLLEEHQLVNRQPRHSFESNKLRLHFQSTYFMMTGQPTASLSVFYELNKLFEENKSLWQNAPLYYVYLLNGILTDLRVIRKYAEMDFFLARLQAIEPTSHHLRCFIKYARYQHCISRLVDLGQFDEALPLVNTYQQEGLTKATVSFSTKATLSFLSAQVFFGLAQYATALQWVNWVLNSGEPCRSHPLYVQCRLLHLMIHLELGNGDYLGYEVRSVERKLKAEKKLYEVEKALLTFIKNCLRQGQRKGLYKKFGLRLLEIAQDPVQRQMMQTLQLLPWVNAKIADIPLPQAILEQYQAETP